MPFIEVKVIEGVFGPEEKERIVTALTDAMVGVAGEPLRQVTRCVVQDVPSGSWGIGGRPMTTADVRALAATG